MLTLALLCSRVAGLLEDPGGLIWTADLLEPAVRQALGEYSRARGAVQTLAGLDGAAETSVPALDEPVLASGAAAYALLGRLARRSESFNLNQRVTAEMTARAQASLAQFQRALEAVQRNGLHTSTSQPWSEWILDL